MKQILLDQDERGIIAFFRAKKFFPHLEIRRKKKIGNLEIEFHWRSKKNLWGRFGGGWNWSVGIQIGGSTVLLNLLVATLRFTYTRIETAMTKT